MDPGVSVGGWYRSPLGTVVCRRERHDGFVEVSPVSWRLADGRAPVMYLKRSDLAELFIVNAQVECAFGRGVVRKVRSDGVYEVDITSWRLANDTIPRAYLQADAMRHAPSQVCVTGEVVATAYGEAVVKKARWDGVYELKPKAWKLANNCTPTFYLQANAMIKLAKRSEFEASVQDHIARANAYKAEGNQLFKAKKYEEAALSYLRALNVLRFVPEELKNSEKAQIIELSVPTHNNLASCYVRMNQPNDAAIQATNAIKILDAIESVIPNGQVYQELLLRGVTDQKLCKDWRIKGLFLLGKSMVMRGDCEVAISVLRKALSLTGEPGNADIRHLIEQATKVMEKHKRESKKLWSKAFQKRSEQVEPDEEETAVAKSAPAAAAPTPIAPLVMDPSTISDLTAHITKDLKPSKSFTKGKGAKKAASSPTAANEKSESFNTSSLAMLAVTATGLLAAGAFLYLRGRK